MCPEDELRWEECRENETRYSTAARLIPEKHMLKPDMKTDVIKVKYMETAIDNTKLIVIGEV